MVVRKSYSEASDFDWLALLTLPPNSIGRGAGLVFLLMFKLPKLYLSLPV